MLKPTFPPTYPKELPETRVIGFTRPALCILQVLGKPKPQNFQHAIDRIIGGSNRDEGVGRVEVVPVLEVRGRLEELGWKREADGGEIGNANEPGSKTLSARILLLGENVAGQVGAGPGVGKTAAADS